MTMYRMSADSKVDALKSLLSRSREPFPLLPRPERTDDGQREILNRFLDDFIWPQIFREDERIESILVRLFGDAETAAAESARWGLVIATTYDNWNHRCLTIQKHCRRHGAYSDLTEIETPEQLEFAKANADVNTCISCSLLYG